MKIALLAHNLQYAGGRSVGLNVVNAMPGIAPQHQYLMIIPEGYGYCASDVGNDVKTLMCPSMNLAKRFWWERHILRRLIHQFQPNWLWALGNIPQPNLPCKQSLLLHNSNRMYPEISRIGSAIPERIFKSISDRALALSVKWTHRVYCQTETMRQRFHERTSYPLERIGLCPNAFSSSVIPSQTWPAELEPYRGSFILFTLTRYYPHKNLEIIVDTFQRYREDLQDVICVISVDRTHGEKATALLERIFRSGLAKFFVCVGNIPQERLGEFFQAADVMFLPTLLESFSGTYLESMQLDTPILTSDRDFAREVCDNAAEYIEPLSPESIKEGILRLKNNAARRSKLVANGRVRIQKYLKTWPEILRDVLDQEGIEHS